MLIQCLPIPLGVDGRHLTTLTMTAEAVSPAQYFKDIQSNRKNQNENITALKNASLALRTLYAKYDSIRKAREANLITRGNTLQRLGLNKKDVV